MTPKAKLAVARLYVAIRAPYFTTALVALVPRETPGLGTIGVTDKMIMLWDPVAVDEWSVEEVAAVLVHEVGHVIRNHRARAMRQALDPVLANLAGDMEINDDLIGHWKLPGDAVLPALIAAPNGLTMEEYYHRMRQSAQPVSMGGGGKNPTDGPDKPGAGEGWCGSCAGRPVPNEPKADDPQGRTLAEVTRIEVQVAEAMKAQEVKQRGTVPGGWLRWADDRLKPPQIRWQDKLARLCRHAVAYRPGAMDYRFTHLSRRQAAVGYGPGFPLLPALRMPVPNVAVVVDTSGSMSQKELEIAMAEVDGVMRAVRVPVDFVACDAEVHGLVKTASWREAVKHLKGGGGTDFCPAFDALAARRPRAEVVVFVTDLCGTFPEVPPARMRVVWVALNNPDGKAPFGETVHVVS